MVSYPLSRKNSLILAAAGLILIATFCLAAMQNAHARSAGVTGGSGKQATLDQSTGAQTTAVPAAIFQAQPAPTASGNSSSDQSSVTPTDNNSSGSESTHPATTSYSKPGGIEPAVGNTPDPDTYKQPIVNPGGPIVVPTPPHPICHIPMVMPKDGPPPTCAYPYPVPPCHPQQPGAMIACPIAYRAE